MTLLKLQHIHFSYKDNPIFSDLSFQMNSGEFVMILGPNGSGKTTMLNLITGLLQPASGKILLNEKPLKEYSAQERAALTGVVSQTAPPVFDFTVKEMVMMGRHAKLSPLLPPTIHDRKLMQRAIEQMDLTELSSRVCNTLSSGERQRTAIAAALALEPELLLLDEPTSALDPNHTLRCMQLFQNLPHKPGILMIVHDLQLASQFAQKIILMNHGMIYAAGKTDEVLTPQNLKAVYQCEVETLKTKDGRLYFILHPSSQS